MENLLEKNFFLPYVSHHEPEAGEMEQQAHLGSANLFSPTKWGPHGISEGH